MGNCHSSIPIFRFCDQSKRMRPSFQFVKTGNLYNHKSFNVYFRVLTIGDFDNVDKLADFLFLDLNSFLAVLLEKWKNLLPVLNFIFENRGKTMCNVIIESYREGPQVFGWHCVLAYDGNDATKIENYIDKSKKKVRNALPFNDTSCIALAGFGQKKFETSLHSLFGVNNNQMPFQSSLIWIAECDVKRIWIKKRQERRVKSKIVLVLTALRLLHNLKSRLNDTSEIQETLTKQKGNFLKLSMELIQDVIKSIGDSPDDIFAAEKSILIQHTQFVKNLIGYFNEFKQAGKDFNDDALCIFEEWNTILIEICRKMDTLAYRFYDGVWCIVDYKAIRYPANRICASKTNYKKLKNALKLDEKNKHKIIIWPATNDADDIFVYLSTDKRYPVNFTEPQALETGLESSSELSHYYVAACSCDPDKLCAWICTHCKVFVQVLQNARIACKCGTRVPPTLMVCIETCGENYQDLANLSNRNVNNLETEASNVDYAPKVPFPAVLLKETTVEIELEINKRHNRHSVLQYAPTTDSDSGFDNGTNVADTDSMSSKLALHFNEAETADITLPENTLAEVSTYFTVCREKKETQPDADTNLTTFNQNFNNGDIKMDNKQLNDDKITPIKMFETIYHVNSTSQKSMDNESNDSELPQTSDCFELNHATVRKLNKNVTTDVPVYTVVVAGATGAGKSTLLNNIWCMQQNGTFDKALENMESNFLLPVRIEEGIDGELQVIEYGNHEYEAFSVGQFTTQRPKDYIVDYGDFKVRFVDTPGTNDTRGDEQDRTNVKFIQDHLTSLDEVHGILFVIKTDDSKLSPDFRRTLNMLLELLPRKALNNCCFVYTFSAITSHFTPGPARQAVQTFFNEFCGKHQLPQLQLTDRNQYCVDNEAFRYIVVHHQGGGLNNGQQYRSSWENTSKNVDRLLEHVKSVDPITQNEFKSVKLLNELGTIMRQKVKTQPVTDQTKHVMATVANNCLSGSAIFCRQKNETTESITTEAMMNGAIENWSNDPVVFELLQNLRQTLL